VSDAAIAETSELVDEEVEVVDVVVSKGGGLHWWV
jgi:hypothetical protein